MARLIPDTLPADAPMSERLVFDAFARLGDSWTVMWDVPVGMFGRPRADLRQIDFLLLHERLGIFVVEVKGGAIKSDLGEWWTQPRGSSKWEKLPKSPFKQAADQRYTLQRYLTRSLRTDASVFAHAVVFPAMNVAGDLGPDAPRGLVLDLADLRSPAAALQLVRKTWGECSGLARGAIDNIVAALKPSFDMAVVSAAAAAETGKELERETRRQAQMVESQIEAYKTLLSTDRVVVLGGAGTGKTVVAAQLATQLSSTGNRTLLLCHRPGVQSFLHTLLGIRPAQRHFDAASTESLTVTSWPRLTNAVAQQLDRSSVKASSHDLIDLFFEFRDSLAAPYDAIVIDEGQEFTHRQIDALTWLLDDPDSSPMYIFADPFQHSGIYSASMRDRHEKNVSYKWRPPIDAQPLLLTTNCRNSSPISDVAARFYPDAVPTALVDGPPPSFHQVAGSNVLSEAFNLVARLLNEEGIHPNQLLVVPIGIPARDVERAAQRAGIPVVAIDGIFRFPLTPKDLRVAWGLPDDVQGLEADVTVVVHHHGLGTVTTSREIYIAASRGRSLLHVVSNLSEADIFELGRQNGHENVITMEVEDGQR